MEEQEQVILEDLEKENAMPEESMEEVVEDPHAEALAEWDHRYKRLQADFDNFRRRTTQEREQLATFVKSQVIEDVLPVLDNFERALSVESTGDAQSFLEGFTMIHQQLMAMLSKQGLAIIEAVGLPFDPNFHEAIMRVPSEEYDNDVVCEILQTGYMVDGRVIRPALVKVVHNG